MPAQRLSLDFKGLVTAPGQLAAPNGSLTTATNCDFPAPGLVEKRVGIEAATYGFGGACWGVISSKMLGDVLLFSVGNGSASSNLQYGTGNAARTGVTTPDATSFSGTPAARMKAAISLRNHFLTSSRAIARLESDMSLWWAGMPRSPGYAMPPQTSTALVAGASNFLAAGYAVAYRVTWVRKDADGVEMESTPSGRWVVANIATTAGYTGAARDVKLNIIVPYQSDTNTTAITTAWKFRVSRSFQADTATGQPSDEMQLCYEASPTAGEIAAGLVTITDECPEAALGAYLYTNTVSGGDVSSGLVRAAAGLGLAASNDRPPLAKDVESFADCLWYADFTTLHRTIFSILAVGAAGNVLKVGDVLTVAGTSLAGVAGAPAANQFIVETGLGSVSANVRQTAINLVEAINRYCTTVTASYIGSDASPGTIGQILVEARRSDASSFGISTTGSAVPFLPQLTGGLTSTQDTWRNGIAISKPFRGDAVPPANYLRVGRNDTSILRVMRLRDALFIFTDDGIWWARGTSPQDFVIESFDATFRLLARDALVACGDALYAWGAEGIARITNGGVEYLDLPIRNLVREAQVGLDATVGNFASRAFAVAYRVARRVLFFFPGGDETGGYACNRALVYHLSTNAWSLYDFSGGGPTQNGKLCGVVRYSDELLHLGEWSNGADTLLYRDRSSRSTADYKETWSNSSVKGITTTLEWTSAVPNPAGLCHWTELHVYFSPSDVEAWKTLPSLLSATVQSEHGGSVTTSISAPSTLQARTLLGPAVGMAARQTVTVTHDQPADYFSSSGFGLLYHPVSQLLTR